MKHKSFYWLLWSRLKLQLENLQIFISSYIFQITTIMKFYEIIIFLNMKAINLKICWTLQILYEKLKGAIPTEVCERLHHF
jgi:hypothetical protein